MQAVFNVSSSCGGAVGLISGGYFIKNNVANFRWVRYPKSQHSS